MSQLNSAASAEGIAVSIKARATQNDVAGKNQRVVREWQEITAAIQYHAMGCCCGVLLLQHSIVCCQGMEHAASWLSHHAVHGSLMWLMGAPAGVQSLIKHYHFLG